MQFKINILFLKGGSFNLFLIMAAEKDLLVFVVEDNRIFNRVVSEHIKKEGYTNIQSVFSGEECMEQIKKGTIPDIVIQDYNLDGMNGIDVLKLVKKQSPETEFIFLTSSENMDVAVNTIKFGAYDYIVKDQMALEKLSYKLKGILRIRGLKKRNKQIQILKVAFLVFVVVVVLFAFFLYFVVGAFQ